MRGMGDRKYKYVHSLFERVADGYDEANDRISLGRQKAWKRMLVRQVLTDSKEAGPMRVLDVCCGTGDIALMIARKSRVSEVTGLDFSEAMLTKARLKKRNDGLENVRFVRADAEHLPFEDETFHAATISFGLRNTADPAAVLKEMKRVVMRGGSVYVMDSCVPDNMFVRPFYRFYFYLLMPLIGGGMDKRKEYTYLARSTEDFMRYDALIKLFRKTGLRRVRGTNRMFGACVLVKGQKSRKL